MAALTETQIERTVEIRMNAIDRRLMNNELTQEGYDKQVMILDTWAKAQYNRLKWEQRMKDIKEFG